MNRKEIEQPLEFVVLVGLPCSGKSTFTKQVKYDGYFVVSIDDIIMSLYPDLTYNQAYHGEHKCKHCNFIYANKIFKQLLLAEIKKKERSIIVDKTNLTTKSRKRLLATVPKEYKKIAVLFKWDMEVIKERNTKRAKETGKFISETVLNDMNSMFIPINENEGFNKIISVNNA
jgi:predicted kinase